MILENRRAFGQKANVGATSAHGGGSSAGRLSAPMTLLERAFLQAPQQKILTCRRATSSAKQSAKWPPTPNFERRNLSSNWHVTNRPSGASEGSPPMQPRPQEASGKPHSLRHRQAALNLYAFFWWVITVHQARSEKIVQLTRPRISQPAFLARSSHCDTLGNRACERTLQESPTG